jgi:hypothetical protein
LECIVAAYSLKTDRNVKILMIAAQVPKSQSVPIDGLCSSKTLARTAGSQFMPNRQITFQCLISLETCIGLFPTVDHLPGHGSIQEHKFR